MSTPDRASLSPWQQLERKREELLTLQHAIHGEIHELAHIAAVLELGAGSEIMAGCVLEGHVRIGRNCRIGPNAYIRGCCEIGDGCRIGHAVELKDCIIGSGSFISHLSYLGDSILEADVNLGAGCMLSNFRHDAGAIRMPWQGELCTTARNKLGSYIGAHSRLGCNSVVLPGRVLPEATWLDAGAVYRG